MKRKLLLLFLILPGLLQAQVVCEYPQGVITSLVITEARITSTADAFVEITNMGSTPIPLGQFKFGNLNWPVNSSQIFDLCNDPWYIATHNYLFLPNKILDPGKSFILTTAYDYGPRHYKEGLGRLGGSERPKQPEMYEIADKFIHKAEPVLGIYYPGDSVTTAQNDPEPLKKRGDYAYVFGSTGGTTYYLEHHYAEGDSAVIDQVGGVFDENGRNRGHINYDIAGIVGGVNNSMLIRKAYVVRGNVDFASGRGVSIDDSEWIPIPFPAGYNSWRDVWWTVGNHGNFTLDANTLEPASEVVTVDYASKKITVPWGTMRLDEIMRHMKRKPGVAWYYDLNPIREDSLYRSARTGDQLTIFVAGTTLQSATFTIEVKEPLADDNMVIPIDRKNDTGPVTTRAQNGILSWPRVTRHSSGTDTITGSGFGLAYDLRSDTLLKYLEKPPKATWEFIWVDGQLRPDLKNGDQLKVVSESGKEKIYFIQIQSFNPNSNADLAAITWPDIPDFYRGLFGWQGDTIPNFASGTTNYRVQVPSDVEGIPALKAKTSHVNASVKVTRAKSLTGTIQDRTVTFEVTAENDTVKKTYAIELVKEKLPFQIEPFHADPFFSEFVNSYPNGIAYLEIYNPGNQPIDLRDYMFGMRLNNDDYYPIKDNVAWLRRYTTYIPGLKHVDEATWAVTPRYMQPDPNVNPIIAGGETFVLAYITRGEDYYSGISNYWVPYDVQFANHTVPGHPNPWNENMTSASTNGVPMLPNGNRRGTMMLYKVLNDSIKLGLKPNTDVNDFELIDIMGMPESAYWIVGGYVMSVNETGNIFIRKPEISKGNPVRGGSFGTNPDDCEWIRVQPGITFSHISTPARYGAAWSSLNQHFMIEPTYYKSTVNSSVYKVSQGYGPGESIMGLKTGTTVADFLSKVNKEDEGQSLKVLAAADQSELGMDAVIGMNDKLVVVSADGLNTTHYRLDVTEAGLSTNAYLSSTRWNIQVSEDPKSGQMVTSDGVGSVAGFDYGTTIKTVVDNIQVPAGATMTVIDGNGAYVPFTMLNFDTVYVSVTVNPEIFLDVVAEDGITRIVYQLQPNTSANDAFILSDMYTVSQLENLISLVPRGTNFQAFLSNIIPSLGATLKLVDKMGFERLQGNIREDDKVVVTSANGLTTRVYFIAFLPTTSIPIVGIPPYVLSDAYTVDQVNSKISAGIATLTAQTLLSEFLSYITPSMGATVTIIDKNGNEKSTGDLDDGDKLKVISADGKLSVMYSLDLDLTALDKITAGRSIEIWPNPVNGMLNVGGLKAGDRIRIYSASGSLISEQITQGNIQRLSTDQLPSGLFMIEVSNHKEIIGRYKAIRK